MTVKCFAAVKYRLLPGFLLTASAPVTPQLPPHQSTIEVDIFAKNNKKAQATGLIHKQTATLSLAEKRAAVAAATAAPKIAEPERKISVYRCCSY